jgi:hypothetical protein
MHSASAFIDKGIRESSFTSNRRFPARKKLSEATGEGPLPDWKVAREAEESVLMAAETGRAERR